MRISFLHKGQPLTPEPEPMCVVQILHRHRSVYPVPVRSASCAVSQEWD